MGQQFVENAEPAGTWMEVDTFEEFAAVRERGWPGPSPSCWWPSVSPVRETGSFPVAYRCAAVGSITLLDADVGCAIRMDGEICRHYHVTFRIPTTVGTRTPGSSIGTPLGDGTVHTPESRAVERNWVGRKLDLMMERDAVDAAFSDALGRSVRTKLEFASSMRASTGAAGSWIKMVSLLSEHVFRPDSVLNQPIVGLPFVDSLLHGLLLAVEHPYHDELATKADDPAPPAIRTAVDVIEAEAERPLTVSEIAARSNVSARSLQLGFRQHLGTTPMAYLRDVRLRRAHQELLESDPSVHMVARIAYRWGFSNMGRFAAVHAARYGESPAVTLRRTPNDARRGRSRQFSVGRTRTDGVRAG